jgi:hypothetical protein
MQRKGPTRLEKTVTLRASSVDPMYQQMTFFSDALWLLVGSMNLYRLYRHQWEVEHAASTFASML